MCLYCCVLKRSLNIELNQHDKQRQEHSGEILCISNKSTPLFRLNMIGLHHLKLKYLKLKNIKEIHISKIKTNKYYHLIIYILSQDSGTIIIYNICL